MKKRRKKSIIRTFLFLIAIFIYIFSNLSGHQIYYYTHSQKTDKRLTPIVVIYSLGEIMIKPKRESDGKYEYVSPGNAIIFEKSKYVSVSYGSGDKGKELHSLFSIWDYESEISMYYHLSPKLKITNIVEFSPDKIHDVVQKPEDQAMVDRYVKQLTDHVLETRVVPPLFNLQWLYDLTFDEKKVLHLGDE
ncbi:hypothetical protein HZY93_04335 [Streptococcus danieliae]|uniref:Uncharacterized protein n=1 Tax=Streptococcus danieliae TaxID=747656 RepID=A0A7Z0LDA6_9STRE|nr:hypothetical protein [Streptococcus danieliae]MBF0717271.1 hypothetical protein [Streptococcus danieliae]NYS49201.1 hypothetical protein [Streptococcus danieliae]